MFTYNLAFPKYSLREYEKKLALMELASLFPGLQSGWVVDGQGVRIQTQQKIDESKLKRLVFFASFSCIDSDKHQVHGLTDQAVVENYGNGRKVVFLDRRQLIAPKRREIRYLSHSLHEYKGRFYPQIVGALINCAGISRDATVLDPFSGSGTTLLESGWRGMDAVGMDINPIGVLIARAKIACLRMCKTAADHAIEEFGDLCDSSCDWQDANFPLQQLQSDVAYLQRWFPHDNLLKIFFLMEKIVSMKEQPTKLLCQAVLSNLLRSFSYQAPKDLRVRRRKDNPPSDLISTFRENLHKQLHLILDFQRSPLYHGGIGDCQINIFNQDSRRLVQNAGIAPNSIDVVITSPPYATALPYIDTDRLSLILFGFENRASIRALESALIGSREISNAERASTEYKFLHAVERSSLPGEIIALLETVYLRNKQSDAGFRRLNMAALLYKYFVDMEAVLQQMKVALKKGSRAYMVIGQNATTAGGEKIIIPTDDFIARIAEQNGFKLVEKIDMAVQKPYTIYSKNAIKEESIIVLEA